MTGSWQKAVVMFYGDWYPFCKRLRPALKSAKSKYRKLGALVNEDENPLWDRSR